MKSTSVPIQDEHEAGNWQWPENCSFLSRFWMTFFLAPQAAFGAVGKWESCFWISTFP